MPAPGGGRDIYFQLPPLHQEETDLNINNKNGGQTAIMKVAGKVHDDIFHYLHEAGADLNIKFI